MGGATYARVVSKRRTGGRDRAAQVHTITSTQGPLGEDIDRRARRYLAQMVVRTLCFLGAVVTWNRVPAWLSVTMLVGAVVLPYIAVVLANAGRERPERADSFLELRELGGAPVTPPLAGPNTTPPRAPSDGGPYGAGPSWDPQWDEPTWQGRTWEQPTASTPDPPSAQSRGPEGRDAA